MSQATLRRPSLGQLLAIPDGPEGIRVTLEAMRRLVRVARVNPDIQALAIHLTAGLPNEDFYGEIERLFTFVRDQIRYVQDTNDVEVLRAPQDTLDLGAGDC